MAICIGVFGFIDPELGALIIGNAPLMNQAESAANAWHLPRMLTVTVARIL